MTSSKERQQQSIRRRNRTKITKETIGKISLSLICIWMLVVATGCGKDGTVAKTQENIQVDEMVKAEGTENGQYPRTITTYNAAKEPVEITFDKAPERVVAVYQDSVETLIALGLEDRIVAAAGLDEDVKEEYKEGFSRINYLTEFSPDKESVMILEPDLIVSWYSYFGEQKLGDVKEWHERGTNTYMMLNSGATEERDLENEYRDILNLGTIFAVEEKAQSLVNAMKLEIENVVAKTAHLETRPRTLLLEVEKDGIRVYGDHTLGGDMVRQLGGDLVTAPNNHMSYEGLIEQNPDVIFTVYFGSSSSVADAQAAVESITQDARFKSLQAVQEGRVYAISLGEIYCSGTRTLDGIHTLSTGMYGIGEVE